MLPILENNKIPLKQIQVNQEKVNRTVKGHLESLLSEDPDLKYLAQKVVLEMRCSDDVA